MNSISLLVASMFVHYSREHKVKVDESVRALQLLLRDGQCLVDDSFHNAGWYNKLGEKIGWGDLSRALLSQIPALLPKGEVFIVLYESDSHWRVPDHLNRMAPGVDYILKMAAWVATSDGWYFFPNKYDHSEYIYGEKIESRGQKVTVQSREFLEKLLRPSTTEAFSRADSDRSPASASVFKTDLY